MPPKINSIGGCYWNGKIVLSSRGHLDWSGTCIRNFLVSIKLMMSILKKDKVLNLKLIQKALVAREFEDFKIALHHKSKLHRYKGLK